VDLEISQSIRQPRSAPSLRNALLWLILSPLVRHARLRLRRGSKNRAQDFCHFYTLFSVTRRDTGGGPAWSAHPATGRQDLGLIRMKFRTSCPFSSMKSSMEQRPAGQPASLRRSVEHTHMDVREPDAAARQQRPPSRVDGLTDMKST